MKKLILCASLLAVFSAHAQAEQLTMGETTGTLSSKPVPAIPKGFMPYLGVAGGYTANSNSAPVEGTPLTAKLLGSYYLPSTRAVFDLGAGISNQSFTHNTAVTNSKTGAVIEAAARYQWASRWQAGVVANDMLNQGASFAASQADAQFVGVQALKEFNMANQWIARAGARAMTETNNTGTPVNMFLAEFQLGWNPSSRQATVENVAQAEPVVAPAPAAPYTEVNSEAGSIVLREKGHGNSKIASFASSKYNVGLYDQAFLKKLGKALGENRDLFTNVKIHGFADISGQPPKNVKLSEKRAERVRNELLASSSLDTSYVSVVGEGATTAKKTVTPDDRRVDIEIEGVKDKAALSRVISGVK